MGGVSGVLCKNSDRTMTYALLKAIYDGEFWSSGFTIPE
jgi:hypothetical protein